MASASRERGDTSRLELFDDPPLERKECGATSRSSLSLEERARLWNALRPETRAPASQVERGEVASVDAAGLATTEGARLECDVLVKCTGFWKAETVRGLVGSNVVSANNVVRRNVVY